MARIRIGVAAFFSPWVLVAIAALETPASAPVRAMLERGAALEMSRGQELALRTVDGAWTLSLT